MKTWMNPLLFTLSVMLAGAPALARQPMQKMTLAAPMAERAAMKQELQRYSGRGNPQARDSVGCGEHACLCEGGKQCLKLIDSGRCKPESFKCVGPPPICICEQGRKSVLPLKSR